MGKSARAKFNMLLLSIKDEQLQNILSNKYLNSSAQEKKHVAYPLITSVSRGSERQLFDANKQTRQTRWAHYRRAKALSRDTQPLSTPPLLRLFFLHASLPLSLSFRLFHVPLISPLISRHSSPFISCFFPLSSMFLISKPPLFWINTRSLPLKSKEKRERSADGGGGGSGWGE